MNEQFYNAHALAHGIHTKVSTHRHVYASPCAWAFLFVPLYVTVLESRQVALDVPSKNQGEALGPASWPLECTVWACADQGKKMAASHGVELLKQHSLHVSLWKEAWLGLFC